MVKGFRNFLMRGDVIVIAIGLVVALAFSNLVQAFTNFIIKPIVARAQGGKSLGLGVQLGKTGNSATFLNFGELISAIIYFLIFMAVIYFVIVLPYRKISARRGVVVFGDPAPTKTCPACLSDDIPVGATKCRYCTSDLAATT
jgi:large conductance mechanosensitive channel